MKKLKAFMLVGDRHWGKSRTLRALTDGRLLPAIVINLHSVSIKRRSNDDPSEDDPQHFWRFISNLSGTDALIAFCPKFDADSEEIRNKVDAPTILDKLKQNYELVFWVIKHSQNPKRKRRREIDEATLENLRDYGTVEIFDRMNATPEELAEDLEQFLEKSLP